MSGDASKPIDTTTVDFRFDVMRPWAGRLSLWMRDLGDQLRPTVNWKLFSLDQVRRREGERHPWERDWASSNRGKVVGFAEPSSTA